MNRMIQQALLVLFMYCISLFSIAQTLNWTSSAGQCFENNGIGASYFYTSVPSSGFPDTALTIEAWVYHKSGGAYTLVEAGALGSLGGFALKSNGNGPYVELSTATGTTVVEKTNRSSEIFPDKWNHIAITWSKSEDRVRVYINGYMYYDKIIADLAIHYPSGSKLYIGASKGGGFGYLNGKVDEMRIWNRALTQSEIRSYKNQFRVGTEQGLVALYHFNGLSSNFLIDQSNSGLNATPINLSTAHWVSSAAQIPSWDSAQKQMIVNTNWQINKDVQKGVNWKFHEFTNLFGKNQNLNIIEINPDSSDVHFEISAVADGVSYIKTSAAAQGAQAVAAINGSYWHTTGIINDNTPPLNAATTTGLSVYHRINGVDHNQTYEYHAMPNHYFGTAETQSVDYADKAAFVFDSGAVNATVIQRPLNNVDSPFVSGWNGFTAWDNVISSGPLLLQNNQDAFEYVNAYRQWNYGEKPWLWQMGEYPFSAIGTASDGRIFLVTGDSRNAQSQGLSNPEIAQVMLALGCENAMKLDGGGSACMYIDGEGIVSYPSDNGIYDHAGERSVGSHILVVPNTLPQAPKKLCEFNDVISSSNNYKAFFPSDSGKIMFSSTIERYSSTTWSALGIRSSATDATLDGGIDLGRNGASSGFAIFDYLDHKGSGSGTARKAPSSDIYNMYSSGFYTIIGEIDLDSNLIRAWYWDGIKGSLDINNPLIQESFSNGFNNAPAYLRTGGSGNVNYYYLRLNRVHSNTQRQAVFDSYLPNNDDPDSCITTFIINANANFNGDVELSWAPINLVDSVLIRYRAQATPTWIDDTTLIATDTSYVVTQLLANTTYEFQVIGKEDWFYKQYSLMDTVTTLNKTLPKAGFFADTTLVITGNSVWFTDSSLYNPVSWQWSFKGGFPATANNDIVEVKYDTVGVFDVRLIATSISGSDTAEYLQYIKVIDPAPVADFVATDTLLIEGNTITYTDLSINNPTEWNWKFDGGTPSTSIDRTPEVVYTKAGTYTVSLISSNDAGASTPEVKTAYIVVLENIGTDGEFIKAYKCSIYPNPTSSKLNIKVNSASEQELIISVYDIAANKLGDDLFLGLTNGGEQTLVLDLKDYIDEAQILVLKIQIGKDSYRKIIQLIE